MKKMYFTLGASQILRLSVVAFSVFCFLFVNAPRLNAQAGSDCQNAIIITPGTYMVDSLIHPNPVFSGATKAQWYKFTPTQNGIMSIGSCLQGQDTRLGVFVNRCDSLVVAGYSDDDCPERVGSQDSLGSSLTKFVRANTTYYIVWDNAYDSSRFQFNLALNTTFVPRAGEDCAMAINVPITLTGNTFTTRLRIDSMTGRPTRTDASYSKWYRFTTPAGTGRVTISTCGEGEDTRLFLYRGTCAALQSVAESDDDCTLGAIPLNWAAALTNINTTPSTTYYFEFDDLNTDGFHFFNFTYQSTVGTSENQALKNNLSVFPNPANDVLTISTRFEKPTSLDLQLVNALGQVVLSRSEAAVLGGSQFSLDVRGLARGFYQLVATDENGGRIQQKIVLE